MNQICIRLIQLYQKTLSPDHGPLRYLYPFGYCRFHPSCSQYAIICFQTLTFWSATILSTRRLLKCHPFSQPRIDYPPTSL